MSNSATRFHICCFSTKYKELQEMANNPKNNDQIKSCAIRLLQTIDDYLKEIQYVQVIKVEQFWKLYQIVVNLY